MGIVAIGCIRLLHTQVYQQDFVHTDKKCYLVPFVWFSAQGLAQWGWIFFEVAIYTSIKWVFLNALSFFSGNQRCLNKILCVMLKSIFFSSCKYVKMNPSFIILLHYGKKFTNYFCFLIPQINLLNFSIEKF